MQMINEVTVMQSNKNLFNKILTTLKKCKSKIPLRVQRVSGFVELDPSYPEDVVFYIDVYYDIGKIYTLQDSGKVFFCAEIMPRVFVKGTAGGGSFPEDPALSFICYKKEYLEDNNWRVSDNLRKELISDGITKNSTQDEIKKTEIYSKIDKAVKDVREMTFDVVLRKEVQKTLKTRENVVPVIIYTPDNDEFNYPFTELSDYYTPNATSCRTNISRSGLMRGSNILDMCKYAMRYTPYTVWTTLRVKNRPLCIFRIRNLPIR